MMESGGLPEAAVVPTINTPTRTEHKSAELRFMMAALLSTDLERS
jgi:hypothetical protein